MLVALLTALCIVLAMLSVSVIIENTDIVKKHYSLKREVVKTVKNLVEQGIIDRHSICCRFTNEYVDELKKYNISAEHDINCKKLAEDVERGKLLLNKKSKEKKK